MGHETPTPNKIQTPAEKAFDNSRRIINGEKLEVPVDDFGAMPDFGEMPPIETAPPLEKPIQEHHRKRKLPEVFGIDRSVGVEKEDI